MPRLAEEKPPESGRCLISGYHFLYFLDNLGICKSHDIADISLV